MGRRRPDPVVVEPTLEAGLHLSLVEKLKERGTGSMSWDPGFGRFCLGAENEPLLQRAFEEILPLARETFDSDTLLPSYALFAHYETRAAQLFKHRDNNACTYTIDMCIYQKEPWALWVADRPYVLKPNQSLAYFGNDQWHWREEFPSPETNHVAMAFFHFVEPDHWYYTHGRDYVNVLRENEQKRVQTGAMK